MNLSIEAKRVDPDQTAPIEDINGYQTLTFLTVFIFKNLLLNVIISDVPMWPCILYMHMISNLTLIH